VAEHALACATVSPLTCFPLQMRERRMEERKQVVAVVLRLDLRN